MPATRRPDRLVAIARITHFSPYRPTPFGGVWFTVEDGKLVIAPATLRSARRLVAFLRSHLDDGEMGH